MLYATTCTLLAPTMLGHACWPLTPNLTSFKHAFGAQLHAESGWSLPSLPPHDAMATNEIDLRKGLHSGVRHQPVLLLKHTLLPTLMVSSKIQCSRIGCSVDCMGCPIDCISYSWCVVHQNYQGCVC